MCNHENSPKKEEKSDGVVLPAQLCVTEGAASARKSKQERHIPDPDDNTFAELIKESQNDSTRR